MSRIMRKRAREEMKRMYKKHNVTLGGYYTYKGNTSGLQYMDTMTFSDGDKSLTIPEPQLEMRGLERHGNKLLVDIPDWYINLWNIAGKDDPTHIYDGSKDKYVAIMMDYLYKISWSNFLHAKNDNFNRIYKALYAEYSPIENTDRYSEITDSKTGDDTTARTGSDTLTKTGSDTMDHTGTDTMDHTGTDTNAKTGDTYIDYVGGDKVTLGGSDVVTRENTDTTTYDSTNTTSISGSEKTTRGGSDTTTYGKTDTVTNDTVNTTTFIGSETENSTKSGSVLDNSDEDHTVYPFNEVNSGRKESHVDKWTNTRYGKYKNVSADGTTTDSDPYSENKTTSYDGRSDKTTTTGTDTTTQSGDDVVKYGGTEVKEFSNRKDTVAKSGTDSVATVGSDSTEYGKTESRDYIDRKDTTTYDTTDTRTVDLKDATTYGSKDTTTHDTIDTTNYGNSSKTTYDTQNNHLEHTHGNIGVTTNQAMINEEINLRIQSNLMDLIVDDYCSSILKT